MGLLANFALGFGVALLIPIAFLMGLDAISALVLLKSVFDSTMYGGRIPSILLNIVGDEPAMMTCLDGLPMAKQGFASDALVISGVASLVGAFMATVGLLLLACLLAQMFPFGPAEYFALFLLAFCPLSGTGSIKQAKAVMAAAIGLSVAMIGLDKTTAMLRFTFGELHLMDGIDFLMAVVGLFAVAEVFHFTATHGRGSAIDIKLGNIPVDWRKLWSTRWAMLKGKGVRLRGGHLARCGGIFGLVPCPFDRESNRGKGR